MEGAVPGSAGDSQDGCCPQHGHGPHGRPPGGRGRVAKRFGRRSSRWPEPLRRIGSSIHFQVAAASVIAVAASAALSQGAPGRGPVIAAAIAMTGQCHR